MEAEEGKVKNIHKMYVDEINISRVKKSIIL
jgi:hypothetical protein